MLMNVDKLGLMINANNDSYPNTATIKKIIFSLF